MKYNVYSVYDKVANLFYLPIYERGPNQAIGAFKQACYSPDSLLHQFPESYQLCQIGLYDDEGGTFENLPHEVICSASDFVNSYKNENS